MKQFLIMSILLLSPSAQAQDYFTPKDSARTKGDTAYWFNTGGDPPESMGGRLPNLEHGQPSPASNSFMSIDAAYWKTRYERKATEVKEYELLVMAVTRTNNTLYAKLAAQDRIISIYKRYLDHMAQIFNPPKSKTK